MRLTEKADVIGLSADVDLSTAIVEDGTGVKMAATVEDGVVSLGWELDEGISVVVSVALDNCLSTSKIFFCLF